MKQWRRICQVSFGISKSNFPKIQFTSTSKTNKHVQLNLDKDDIENSWKTLANYGKIKISLLVHIIYELGLRTGELCLFGSKILLIKTTHALAYLIQKQIKLSNCKYP